MGDARTALIRFVIPALLLSVIIVKMGLLEPSSEEAPAGEEMPVQTVAVEGPKGTPEDLLNHADEVWNEIGGLLAIAEAADLDQMSEDDVSALIEGLQKARYIASGVPADRRPAWFGSIDARLASLHKWVKDRSDEKTVAPPGGVEKSSVPVDAVDKSDVQGHL